MVEFAQHDTRDRLVQAAAQMLWERGYQSASVEDLCARAGARKGSFYHFFPSKSDLAIAALEFNWDVTRTRVFEPIIAAGQSGLDNLRALVDRVADIQRRALVARERVPGCPFGNLGQETAHQDERLRRVVQRIFDAHCTQIEAWLNQAERLGEIPPGDNRQRARHVFALLEGALLVAKVANDANVFREIASSIPLVAGGGARSTAT